MASVNSLNSFDLDTPPVEVDRSLRVGVKARCLSSGAVLLVKERHEDGSEFWTFPGGGTRPDESLRECLKRELAEELQCLSTVHDVVGDFWYVHRSSPRISKYTVYDCSLLSECQPNESEGIHDHRWVHPDDLPPSTLSQVRYICQSI